jgi:hypothetical protein
MTSMINELKNEGGCVQFDSTIWENVRRSTGSSIPLIIIIIWICSITFFLWSKVYLLEFDIVCLGKIWI